MAGHKHIVSDTSCNGSDEVCWRLTILSTPAPPKLGLFPPVNIGVMKHQSSSINCKSLNWPRTSPPPSTNKRVTPLAPRSLNISNQPILLVNERAIPVFVGQQRRIGWQIRRIASRRPPWLQPVSIEYGRLISGCPDERFPRRRESHRLWPGDNGPGEEIGGSRATAVRRAGA